MNPRFISNLVLAKWSGGQSLRGVSHAPSLLSNLWMDRDKNCVVTDFCVGDHSSNYNTRRYINHLYQTVSQSLEQYPYTCVLGGDHSISEASVCAFFDKYRESGHLLWIDAHPDLQTPETTISGNTHGMVMSAILGLIKSQIPIKYIPHPSQITYIGIRDIDAPEGVRINQLVNYRDINDVVNGLHCYYGPDLLDFGREWPSWLIDRLSHRLCLQKQSNVYISFDVDVLDPSEITNTGTPVSSGLGRSDVAKFFRGLSETNGLDIIGMDVVEFNPEAGAAERVETEASYITDIARSIIHTLPTGDTAFNIIHKKNDIDVSLEGYDLIVDDVIQESLLKKM